MINMFDNRMLRRILGPKRAEITGEWRRLRNWELYDLYSSLSISRVIKSRIIRWAGHVARMGVRCIQGFGRPRRRLEENIKMDLQEVGWGHGLD